MDCQAVENEHVSSVNIAPNPVSSYCRAVRNFGNVKVLVFVSLKSEAMRAFQNPQRTYCGRAVVQRNPHGEALGVSAHETVILVRVSGEAFAIRKDQSSNRFWMNQKTVSDNHLHHAAQRRMVRQ